MSYKCFKKSLKLVLTNNYDNIIYLILILILYGVAK